MSYKIISFSFVKIPLKPYINEYFVAVVVNGKNKKIVQIDKKYKNVIKVGLEGKVVKKKVLDKTIFVFNPIEKSQKSDGVKVALITGSSRGIGRAIALEFARRGMIVIINSRNENRLGVETFAQIKKISPKSSYLVCDVSDEKKVQNLIGKIINKYKKIDILVNNAGIMEGKNVASMDVGLWDKVIDTNLKSMFLCCKEVISYMKNIGGGKIINLTSISGQIGYAGQSHYSASKAGIIGFTKSLAKELAGDNILVNAIAPGFIDTKILDIIPKAILSGYIENIPLKRLGTVEEVAKLVGFLASDDANYITGQVININGGLFM